MVIDYQKTELRQYLNGNRDKLQGFRVSPLYSPEGDTLSIFVSAERCRAERMGQLLTVYLSETTNDVVGCKVKGVSLLADNIETIINVNQNGECAFKMILAATGTVGKREYFYELVRKLGEVTIQLKSLRPTTGQVCAAATV